MPVRAAGGDVVDVEDHVGKALVEDTRLHLKRDLRGDEIGFDVAEGAKAARGEDQGHEQGEDGADDGENANGEEHALATDTQGGESDDFAVHGHATEAEKNADEHGHGDSEDKNAWDDAEE